MSDALDLAEIQQQLARAWMSGDRGVERLIAPDWTVTGADGRLWRASRCCAMSSDTGAPSHRAARDR